MNQESLRQQLGEALWEARLAEARERAALIEGVLAAMEAGETFVAAARLHAPNVRPKLLALWVAKWRAGGVDGLIDRRGGPRKRLETRLPAQMTLGMVLAPESRNPREHRRDSGGRQAGLIKWSGSKQAVVGSLIDLAPPRFARYHEPFVGGGSLFFALQPKPAFLSDRNAELINLYVVVRDEPASLLESLARHRNTREHYSHVRGIHPDSLFPIERAARTLFLNRTCFNGIYRVNKKGIFNVPYGNMPEHGFYTPDAIDRAHRNLIGAQLFCEDFEQCGLRAQPDDFVYLDPPYPRGLRGAVFDPVVYQAAGFSEDDHHRLGAFVRALDRRGVLFMLSNSDCDLTRQIFHGFRIDTLSVHRRVGGHVARRGVAQEIVVTNYDPALPLSRSGLMGRQSSLP